MLSRRGGEERADSIIAVPIHCDASRPHKLPALPVFGANDQLQYTICCACLEAVVSPVRHVDVAFVICGNAHGQMEFARR
jgi:hypothetical protein